MWTSNPWGSPTTPAARLVVISGISLTVCPIPSSFFPRSRRNKKGKGSFKSKCMSVKTLAEIVIHRHPNTNGLQIGVHGGFDEDQFPYVVTATHPRSPYLPLVEGGQSYRCHT